MRDLTTGAVCSVTSLAQHTTDTEVTTTVYVGN